MSMSDDEKVEAPKRKPNLEWTPYGEGAWFRELAGAELEGKLAVVMRYEGPPVLRWFGPWRERWIGYLCDRKVCEAPTPAAARDRVDAVEKVVRFIGHARRVREAAVARGKVRG